MANASFLAATRQRWKLNAPLFALSIAGLVIWLQNSISTRLGPDLTMTLVLTATLVAVASFVVLCTSIRCPRCRSKLFWRAARREPSSSWLPWLLNLKACPDCGFAPGETEHAA